MGTIIIILISTDIHQQNNVNVLKGELLELEKIVLKVQKKLQKDFIISGLNDETEINKLELW